MTRPVLAISRCLLGDAVRYDGQSKDCPALHRQLSQYFELLPICPEVEMGLSVPRPPVQLQRHQGELRMIGRDDAGIDVTRLMLDYRERRCRQLPPLAGYVFKSRSPSCGLHVPVFQQGAVIEEDGMGLFAAYVTQQYPRLPIAEESELETQEQRDAFIQRALDYLTS